MPTERKFTFDVDTKRYLNIVNTYRLAAGLSDIANSDAVDIDNFVIGLKDLGVFQESLFYLFGSKYNIGTGNIAIGIGGYSKNINLINLPVWTNDYILCDTATQYMITPALNVSSYNIPVFGCCIFRYDLFQSGGRTLFNLSDSTNRVITGISQDEISSGGLFRFSGDMNTGTANRGSLVSPYFYSLSSVGFSSLGTSYIPNNCFRQDNSTLTTRSFTGPYDFPQNNIRLSFNANNSGTQGANKGYYYIGGSILSRRVDAVLLGSVYRLIKQTVGKNLNLP